MRKFYLLTALFLPLALMAYHHEVNETSPKELVSQAYETFAAAANQHFDSDLSGKLVVSAGLGGMGGAQPLSVTMNNGIALIIEIDPTRIQRRLDTNYIQYSTDSLNEAINMVNKAINN